VTAAEGFTLVPRLAAQPWYLTGRGRVG